MDLILWRHAEAEEAKPGQEDHTRALTAKGERQAKRMAAWLDQHLPDGTRVLASPAKRAAQTVRALGRPVRFRDELRPEQSVEAVLELLRWTPEEGPQRKGPVLLVGHQPWLGELIARMLGPDLPAFAVRKGAIFWLRTRGEAGAVHCSLVACLAPELAGRG